MRRSTKRLGLPIIILLLLPAVLLSFGSACGPLIFRSNSYFVWEITLWRLPKGGGAGVVTPRYMLWEGYLRLDVTIEPLGEEFQLKYHYTMNYTRVINQTYTAADEVPRVHQGMIENLSASIGTSGVEYIYRLGELKWGFKATFRITPLVFFNVLRKDLVNWLIYNFSMIKLGEISKPCSIVYDSWDIILGTYRRVYYMEMFLPASYLNTTEPISVGASMAEFDFTIDKEYGFIGYLRIYWEYSSYESFEIIAKITDTNLFHHNMFYYTIIMILVILVVAAFTYKRYREKRRLRLIRI